MACLLRATTLGATLLRPRVTLIRFSSSLVVHSLAALLGVLHALSFAPWNLWWLQLLVLAGLFALAENSTRARGAALLGFIFGIGWFATGISWVYISMHEYGQMPAVLAALATLAFAAFLALYPALALGTAHRFVPSSDWRPLVAVPAAWAASEWLRGVLLTGFPWLASGYAHSDGPLAGYAPVVGVYGMSLLCALIAGAAVVALRERGTLRLVVAGLAVVALAGGAALRTVEWTQPIGPPTRVRLAQGNIPQDQKFTEQGVNRAHETYLGLLKRPGDFELAAAPESIYPLPFAVLPESIQRDLTDFVETRRSSLIFGAFIVEPPGRYYNSAIGLTSATGFQRYSKRHLVPFGEFIPFGFRWFVDLMQMPIGDQERGARFQAPVTVAGQKIAVNICYEDLFGAEIIEAWRDPATGRRTDASRAPTILLNLSNLAWFNNSLALPQHLQISRLRALETGRPMLRATNTGATAIIDARGRVVAQLALNTASVLDGAAQAHTGDTPYVRFGDTPALSAIGLLLVFCAWLGRRR